MPLCRSCCLMPAAAVTVLTPPPISTGTRSALSRGPALAGLFFFALLAAAGCSGEPELQVPPREVYCWPAEQFERFRGDPQQRYFEMGALPPQIFFRPGADCGSVRSLRIQVEGWPVGASPTTAPVDMPPPAEQFWVSDRYAGAAARFVPARALEWEPRGGREVVEVLGTAAGASPTPTPAVRFHAGWLYRFTLLAEIDNGSTQRSIWLGPPNWRERALIWDAQ